MASMTAEPDIRQLREQSLPQVEFPGGKNQDYRVVFDPAVHSEIWKHGIQDTSVEICGVLVGRLAADANGPYLHISASIRGEAASNKFAEVTFTHETWNRINQEMDSRFADRSIVGWYHTHPNFGIFLSDRDQFICQHFFSGPGQVAHVVDPIRKVEGVFIWKGGKTTPLPFYWVGDRLQGSDTQSASDAPHVESSMTSVSSAVARQDAPPGVPWWMQAMLLSLMFLLGWLIHGVLISATSEMERQRGFYLGLMQYGLRPGLGLRLRDVHDELHLTTRQLELLSQDHLARIEASDASAQEKRVVKDAWKQLLKSLTSGQRTVADIQATYALSRAEEEMLISLLESQRRRQPELSEPPRETKPSQNSTKDKAATGEPSPRGQSSRSPVKKPTGEKPAPKPPAGKAPTGEKSAPGKSETDTSGREQQSDQARSGDDKQSGIKASPADAPAGDSREARPEP